ncbi:MAG: archaeosine biosynthesis radical SAM protein RaSEA [Thermococci archaeon]|nr:archaeosine biosynthesis radical SAM protein RaSEA [Thermococci archaeon]
MTYWTAEDNVAGKPGRALFVILPTIGCYRYRIGKACYMCAYPTAAPARKWSQKELLEYLQKALQTAAGYERVAVRIFTSGSFLDDSELRPETRREMFRLISRMENVREIVVESRSELVRYEAVRELAEIAGDRHFEVAIGLETANDDVADVAINKGNTFADFVRAADTVHSAGAYVKTYLLLKPAFMSEMNAIEDVKASIIKAEPYTDTFSINPTNVQRGTLYERLWEKREYRPPWLWSVVEVLRWAKEELDGKRVLCDPVGAGSKRGPHNVGGEEDRAIGRAIKAFSTTQDVDHLRIEDDGKGSRRVWEYVVDRGLLDWQLGEDWF